MKAKDLAKQLMNHPEFDVRFSFSEEDGTSYGMSVRVFDLISVEDIGHSDKTLILGGRE